jgi:hypothetical protein
MNLPFLAVGLLMTLAALAHIIIGTRETLSLRPRPSDRGASQAADHEAHHGQDHSGAVRHQQAHSGKAHHQQPPAEEAQRHWTQALCVFQLVSVDLILLTLTVWLLALTDILPARRELAYLVAAWLVLWSLAWLAQLAAVKSARKNYGLLGQWVLFLVCAGLMCWGAQG